MDAVTAIYGHAVLHGTGTFETEPPHVSEMAARYRAIASHDFPFLVAEISGRIGGYAYAAAFRERPAFGSTVEDSVYVDPTLTGRGCGKALLDRLIVSAEQAGFRQMVSVIGDSANIASIRLHAGCGFYHAGRLDNVGWKAGRWLDVVLMQRTLGLGAPEQTP